MGPGADGARAPLHAAPAQAHRPTDPPPALPAEKPDPALDPGAFIRARGIPEIERMERRLGTANHRLRVQDLLDLPEQPSLRVLFWPEPAPLKVEEGRQRATLEFVVRHGADAHVEAAYWIDEEPIVRMALGACPVDRLDAGWLRGRILDFVEAILGRS